MPWPIVPCSFCFKLCLNHRLLLSVKASIHLEANWLWAKVYVSMPVHFYIPACLCIHYVFSIKIIFIYQDVTFALDVVHPDITAMIIRLFTLKEKANCQHFIFQGHMWLLPSLSNEEKMEITDMVDQKS